MANKIMKTLTIGGNIYEVVDEFARSSIEASVPDATLSSSGVPADAKATGDAIDALSSEKVSNTRTINGYALSSDITLSFDDVGAAEEEHTHSKSDITDFSHSHIKSEITDFKHTHTKSDMTDFEHTHIKSDITDFSHSHTKSEITDFEHSHTSEDLEDVVPIKKGGTGGTTAEEARSKLGAAATAHTHKVADISDIVISSTEPSSPTAGMIWLKLGS